MNSETHDEYTTREIILGLLSDEETAHVSTAEATELKEGDEYIDLTRIDRGVLRADGTARPVENVLPRNAVRDRTWGRILKQMAPPLGP